MKMFWSLITILVCAAGCCHHGGAREAASGKRAVTQEAPAASVPAASKAAAPQFGVKSNNGTYFLLISPAPDQLPLNELFSMNVRVLNVDRTPISPAGSVQLTVDAAMPAHHHGMNTKPKVSANPDGSFTVSGMMLHMAGQWDLYFDITRNGVTERAQVSTTLE